MLSVYICAICEQKFRPEKTFHRLAQIYTDEYNLKTGMVCNASLISLLWYNGIHLYTEAIRKTYE